MRKKNNFAERSAIGEMKKIYKELKETNRRTDDDTWFEDDPRAVKEIEYGRVFHEPTRLQTGSTELGDMIISGSNYVRYAKHGSARNGVRYSFRKGGKK